MSTVGNRGVHPTLKVIIDSLDNQNLRNIMNCAVNRDVHTYEVSQKEARRIAATAPEEVADKINYALALAALLNDADLDAYVLNERLRLK